MTVLFDPHPAREQLLPLTFTRPVADLRVGITTIAEKWQAMLPDDYAWAPADPLLLPLYPTAPDTPSTLHIAGNVLPDASLAAAVGALAPGEALYYNNTLIAHRGAASARLDYSGPAPIVIDRVYDIFRHNGAALCADFGRITAGRVSEPLSPTVQVIGPRELVFVEPGAELECCTLRTTGGPVYIGAHATVMEGSLVRGPFALGEHATVNMGTRIYPDTTVGPWCKVGGELNNAVLHSYSNKAHDGFLGNAVVGSWCNLGAGCVASNLKNGYELIRLWDYSTGRFERTGLQFCGLIMGDHSKAGINTSFNTATVVGVGCNIHGQGMPRPYIPSFSDGGPVAGFARAPLAGFLATAERMMARRSISLTPAHRDLLSALHECAQRAK